MGFVDYKKNPLPVNGSDFNVVPVFRRKQDTLNAMYS